MSQKSEAAQKLDQRSFLLVLLFGVAGTIQYFAAQFFSGFDRFFGDRGDARADPAARGTGRRQSMDLGGPVDGVTLVLREQTCIQDSVH